MRMGSKRTRLESRHIHTLVAALAGPGDAGGHVYLNRPPYLRHLAYVSMYIESHPTLTLKDSTWITHPRSALVASPLKQARGHEIAPAPFGLNLHSPRLCRFTGVWHNSPRTSSTNWYRWIRLFFCVFQDQSTRHFCDLILQFGQFFGRSMQAVWQALAFSWQQNGYARLPFLVAFFNPLPFPPAVPLLSVRPLLPSDGWVGQASVGCAIMSCGLTGVLRRGAATVAALVVVLFLFSHYSKRSRRRATSPGACGSPPVGGTTFSMEKVRTYAGPRMDIRTTLPSAEPATVFPPPAAEETCERWAVLTTAVDPTDTVEQLAELGDWCVVVVGDKRGEILCGRYLLSACRLHGMGGPRGTCVAV